MGLKGLVEQPKTLLKARQAGVGLSSAGKFVPTYRLIFNRHPPEFAKCSPVSNRYKKNMVKKV